MYHSYADVTSFCLLAEIQSFDPEQPFSPLRNFYTVEALLRILARELKGRNDLSSKITVTTVQKQWRKLSLCIEQETGQRHPGESHRRLDKVVILVASLAWPCADGKQVIEKDMPRSEQLSTKVREKWLASPPVVKDILHFMWVLDKHEFNHPRVRLQITLSMLILLYSGLRPGEFVESSAHRCSNDGLH